MNWQSIHNTGTRANHLEMRHCGKEKNAPAIQIRKKMAIYE